MAISAFTSPITGQWPLGKITVATPGTAVDLNTNVGTQSSPSTNMPNHNVRQLMFSTGANTGMIYIVRKALGQTVSKATPNFVVAVIGPKQSVSIPDGSIGLSSSLSVDDYSVDADTASDSVFASAYFG